MANMTNILAAISSQHEEKMSVFSAASADTGRWWQQVLHEGALHITLS